MLQLKLDDLTAIELPAVISGCTLTLEEIATIVAFKCLLAASEVPEVMERMKSPEVTAAIESLKTKGVLTAIVTDQKIQVDINLESVMPPSLKADEASSGNDFLNVL